jgi:hypothetical protein
MASAVPDLDELRRIAGVVAPVTLAREHTLPVLDELRPLLPERGLRRGATIAVRGDGASSLAVALAAEVSRVGGWVAGVGVPTLGLSAAAQVGAALQRWVFVDDPGGQAAEVVNALLSGVDLILTGPDVRLDTGQVRRLSARMRERGTSLVRIGAGPGIPADLSIGIERSRWVGVEWGHGRLRARRVELVTTGRGSASRSRRLTVWMPDPDGRLRVVDRPVEPRRSGDSVGPTGEVVDLARRAG